MLRNQTATMQPMPIRSFAVTRGRRRRRTDQVVRREPLRDHQVADQPCRRSRARPTSRSSSRRPRSGRRARTGTPALVGVEGDAAGLVGEHGRGLAVDERLQQPDAGGDRPQHDRPPGPEGVEGEAEEGDDETGVAHGDDEAVPPAQRFEELPLLDDRSGHACPLPPGGKPDPRQQFPPRHVPAA